MASIPTVRLVRKLGNLPDEVMLKIKQAILFALDLEADLAEKGIEAELTQWPTY